MIVGDTAADCAACRALGYEDYKEITGKQQAREFFN